MTADQYIIIEGDVTTGLRFHGPFATTDQAEWQITDSRSEWPCMVATLQPPDHSRFERQWVDTESLTTDGQPRVLTFDEVAALGLDGTGRFG